MKTKTQTFEDFQKEVLSERKKRPMKLLKNIAFVAICLILITSGFWMKLPQEIFGNVLIAIMCLVIIASFVWFETRKWIRTDSLLITSMKEAQKCLLSRNLQTSSFIIIGENFQNAFIETGFPDALKLAGDKELLKQFNAFANLAKLREAYIAERTKLSLLDQKINWLKAYPWEIVSKTKKMTIYAVIVNIMVLGAIWLFIPWISARITLTAIIIVIDFVLFAIRGLAIGAYLRNLRSRED